MVKESNNKIVVEVTFTKSQIGGIMELGKVPARKAMNQELRTHGYIVPLAMFVAAADEDDNWTIIVRGETVKYICRFPKFKQQGSSWDVAPKPVRLFDVVSQRRSLGRSFDDGPSVIGPPMSIVGDFGSGEFVGIGYCANQVQTPEPMRTKEECGVWPNLPPNLFEVRTQGRQIGRSFEVRQLAAERAAAKKREDDAKIEEARIALAAQEQEEIDNLPVGAMDELGEYGICLVDGQSISPDARFIVLRLDDDMPVCTTLLAYAMMLRASEPKKSNRIIDVVNAAMEKIGEL